MLQPPVGGGGESSEAPQDTAQAVRLSAPPVHLPTGGPGLAQGPPVCPLAGGAIRGPQFTCPSEVRDLEGPWGEGSHPLLTMLPARTVCAAAAKSLQLCPILCDPMDSSPPGSPSLVHSPGQNTGVGCHFLLQCMKVKSESEVAQLCLTFRDPMGCSPPGSSTHGIFQVRILEWVAIVFSGGIFPTQGLNAGPLHCRQTRLFTV